MAIEAPSQVMLSSIFSYVSYQQYKVFGSKAWKRLARDGILLMCSAILCKMTCGMIIVSNAFGDVSELFVILDWVISATILVHHCNTTRQTSTVEYQPKTMYILHLSQIATANSLNENQNH
ncbi:hypothetical protein BDF19DRAFT_420660 [Syncephalis fuscata]|nr:hypothetical protein BDF19DRAFT_420660 [Syncephalis fuscata]